MNLFDQLVTQAINNQPKLSTLRTVVEKELLHHDILRILNQNHLLKDLTFIGGTCLRACYNGIRLSEDLDFTGGNDFSRESLSAMGKIIIHHLEEKYQLPVKVSEPIKDEKNVNTWKIKVETKPAQKHLPAQRINIDICRVASYEKQWMPLINLYGIDLGTNGLIIPTQSREEIYADKILAFALRPNRIKHRDLWDMVWLHQQGLKPKIILLPKKLQDRQLKSSYFLESFDQRQTLMQEKKNLPQEFKKEMQRFLPAEQISTIIEQQNLWSFIVYLISEIRKQLHQTLK